MREEIFLGVSFACASREDVLDWIDRASAGERFSYVITPNVDHVVMLGDDGSEPWRALYRDAVARADLRVNDSRILQRLAGFSGKVLPVTPGSDLVRDFVRRHCKGAGIMALIGGRIEEAIWLREAMPGYDIAHFAPPMGVRDSRAAQDAIAEFVEISRADIVLFAIGAPQSEIVCGHLQQRGRARGVALCIGASVEFLSGAKARAPRWMQQLSLEWAFRLASEPRRLWRRYLVQGPRIFGMWWKQERR